MRSAFNVRAEKVRAILASAAFGALIGTLGSSAQAANGTWAADANGNWNDATRWAGGTVADGAGSVANFTFNITADRTVTLDTADRVIGGLTFTDSTTASHNWVLTGGTNVLTLDGTSPLSLNVTNQTATINAIMTTADADLVQKAGSGTLVLNAQNTIAGGFSNNAGTTRISQNSTVVGGVVTSGPVGTSTLTLAGGTFQDNGSARTLQNSLVIGANVTFSSSGTSSLTFNSTGLTTPATIGLSIATPTLTVNNTTNFNNAIVSTNTFIKAGSGRLNIGADNSASWTAANVTSSGGVLAFTSLAGMPTGAARPVTAAINGAVTLGGAAMTQAFVDMVATTSAGVIAIDAATPNALDFTGMTGNVRLGAAGAFTYSGVHTPADPAVYRLGGGGGTLTYAPQITGAGVSVNVGSNGTANGAVIFSETTNDFGGGIAVDAGILTLTVADGTPGGPSAIGLVPAAPANNITLSNGGLLRFGNAAATLNANRSIVLGTGGGGIDTAGNSYTLPNAFSGTGAFIKDGAGTLTVTTIPSDAIIVRGGGTTAGTASVLNLNGQNPTLASLTVSNNSFATGAQTAELVNVNNLTVNGPVTIGSDSPGKLTINAGGQLNVNAAASNFIVMNRPTTTTFGGTYTSTVDASAAASVNLNVNNLLVLNGSGGASGGTPVGVLLLPTAATSTVNITAATALRVATLNNNGGSGTLVFGGGTNVVRTPIMNVGAGKISGTATITPGGSLDIQGLAGGKTALSIADNNANTGITIDSKLDITGGTIGSAATPAKFGAVTIGVGTGGGAGTTTGRFILDGASSVVEADSLTLASGRASNTSATTGILRIQDGTLRVMSGAISHGAAGGSGTRTSTIELVGGLLDMGGRDINSVTNLTFTGGTLRDPGTINRSAGLTQAGAGSVLQILANNSSIAGPYTLTSGTASIHPLRTLAAAGAFDLTSATDTLLIPDIAPLDGTTRTIATYTSLTSGAHFDTVRYFDGTTTQTLTDAQATTPGGLPNNYVLEYGATSLQLVQVPEPSTAAILALAGVGLLRRRRRA